MHYAKPILIGTEPMRDFKYGVVSTQPGMLLLSVPVNPALRPISISIRFLNADTFIATSSNQPLQTTGAIERCR